MENKEIAILLEEIKKKKELSTLPDEMITEAIHLHMKGYAHVSNPSPSQRKILVKEIRAKLRRSAGMFQRGSTKGRRKKAKNNMNELLKTHISTAERIEYYPLLKKKLLDLRITSVLDIGCGLNPLALASPEIHYYAGDIRKDEIDIINDFFKREHIVGNAFIYDIRKFKEDLPKTDIALIWKVLEIVGGDTHKLTEHLLTSLSSPLILMSFSTCTLSGKPMKNKRRIWFEHILKEKKCVYEVFEIPNEIFYLVKKH